MNLRLPLMLVLAMLLACGCNRGPTQTTAQKAVVKAAVADFEPAKEGLRKAHPDVDHLRSILDHINAALSVEPAKRPTPLSDSEKAFLKERMSLTDSQIQHLNQPEFQLLDAHVLDQALVFRDIAHSLGVNKAKPVKSVLAALDWVTRHVRLEERNGPIDPPDRVVLRGRGTGIERIYVLTSLLQQLGFESYAIGDASAASDPQKLWGVGVVVGENVIVLDPRLGLPLPSGKPGEPAKLAEIKADGKPLQELVALGYDVPPERIKNAKLFFGLPFSMLAPRFQSIDPLMTEAPLHVAFDLKKLMGANERFGVSAWSAATAGTPTHVLAEFLPPEEGGLDRAKAGPERRIARFQIDTIPWTHMPREFMELQGPFGNQIRLAFVDIAWKDHQPGIANQVRQKERFVENVRALQTQEKAKELPDQRLLDDVVRNLQSSRRAGEEQGPTLMEMLLRGQNNEAIETMVSLMDQLSGVTKLNVSRDAAVNWAKQAQSAFVELIRAQRSGDAAALNELQGRFAALANESKTAVNFVQQHAARPMLARLSFLIALSKHDQADSRSRQKVAEKEIQSAWQSVADGWGTFFSNFPQAADAFTAHRCRGAALARAGNREAAAEAYRQAAGAAVLLFDRIACSWLAKNP